MANQRWQTVNDDEVFGDATTTDSYARGGNSLDNGTSGVDVAARYAVTWDGKSPPKPILPPTPRNLPVPGGSGRVTLHRTARTCLRSRRLSVDRVLGHGWLVREAAEAAA
jgi:hypothetical protein